MTIPKKAEERLMALLRKAQPSGAGPVIWRRVLEFIDSKIQDLDLRVNADHKISGLPSNILSEWFRQYCDTKGGKGSIAYSRRQRQNIRIVFENARNAISPAAAEPLVPVKNYPRSTRRGFIDQRGMRDFPLGDLERMRSVYNNSISRHGIFPPQAGEMSVRVDYPDKEKAIKLYCLAFGLIVDTGISFPGCFSSICRLKKKHIPVDSDGDLIIPQNPSENLWLCVSLDDTSRLNLPGLLCHSSRRPKADGIRKRQLKNRGGEEYLLGAEPSEKVIRCLRTGFTNWLRHLAHQAGVTSDLTLEMLVQAAQARLPKMYSAEVIASLAGKIHYHPLPPDQIRLAGNDPCAFSRNVDLPRWSDQQAISSIKEQPALMIEKREDHSCNGEGENEESTHPFTIDEELLDSFYDGCQPFLKGNLTSCQAGKAIAKWGKDLLGCEDDDKDIRDLLNFQYQQLFLSNITMEYPLWKSVNIPLVQKWNLACVAGWFAWRLMMSKGRKHGIANPHTFMGYRRDILSLLRSNPQIPLTEIGDEEMEECLSTSDALNHAWISGSQGEISAYRTSTITCWRSIRQYLSTQVGITLPPASLSSRSEERRTHFTRLIPPEEVVRLLEICIERGTQEAYCAYLAILLANFAGLRAMEIVQLRLSQIVVRGDATIYIQHGKGGKNRNVFLDDAPKDAITMIKEARDRRWSQTNNKNNRLLFFPNARPSEEPAVDLYQTKRLSRWVADVMSKAGLRSKGLVGDHPDLHRLRHSYVNRSFLIREQRLKRALEERFSTAGSNSSMRDMKYLESLRRVSQNTGHSTYQMTLEHYVHCINLLQKCQLKEFQDKAGETQGLSEWLGRKALENILDLNHAQAHKILRKSVNLAWRSEGNRKLLGIRRRDFINIVYIEIAPLLR